MNRLRLIDARDEVAVVCGINKTDTNGNTNPALIQLVNEAQRRLCKRGKWVGTVQRYKINVTNSLITWPRKVGAIEAVAFCDCPGTIRNEWFEFLGQGPGIQDCDSRLWHTLIDRGTAPVFKDVTPGKSNRKLRVSADVAEDDNQYITIQGYDENQNWIRTQDADDNWIDGEQILISTTPTLSAKKYTYITGVFKPETNGVVRVYEYNTTTAANVQMVGYYEPDETTPIYRRSALPGIMDTAVCNECDERQITVMVKLVPVPVANDNDWLMLGNLDAIKLACQAILKERKDLQAEAEGYWAKAGRELEVELREYKGDGATPVIRVESNFGGGGILCIAG